MISYNIKFSDVIKGVREGDEQSLIELREVVQHFRFYVYKQLGASDAPDAIQEIYMNAVVSIRKKEPDYAAGLQNYIHTIARRVIARRIEKLKRDRTKTTSLKDLVVQVESTVNHEEDAMRTQLRQIISDTLDTLNECGREILIRFYVNEQSPEQICEEMGLTENQYRLRKSNAKLLLTDRVRKHMSKGSRSRLQAIAQQTRMAA